jgi:hypothetical protein
MNKQLDLLLKGGLEVLENLGFVLLLLDLVEQM